MRCSTSVYRSLNRIKSCCIPRARFGFAKNVECIKTKLRNDLYWFENQHPSNIYIFTVIPMKPGWCQRTGTCTRTVWYLWIRSASHHVRGQQFGYQPLSRKQGTTVPKVPKHEPFRHPNCAVYIQYTT